MNKLDMSKYVVTRISQKRSRENEVFKSDRIDLVDAANELVEHFVAKQVLPTIGSGGIKQEIELTPGEQAAYDAALDFLRRQFEQGYSSPEPFERRVETEDSTDFAQPPTENE